MVVRPDLESCKKSTVRSDAAGAMAVSEVAFIADVAKQGVDNLRSDTLSLKIAHVNYANSISFKSSKSGNIQGVIAGGVGKIDSYNNNYLVAFSCRASDGNISFTDSTFTGTVDSDGNITIDFPITSGWTVIYLG